MTSVETRDLSGKADRSRVNINTKRVGKFRHVDAPGGTMLEMLGRSSDQFSARHTGPGCMCGPLLILSPSACATVAHLFPSSSLPRTRKDGARDAGFLSPPTTTSLTTGVDTHVTGENEPRSRIESSFH